MKNKKSLYTCHSLSEYNAVIELRNTFSWGEDRIQRKLMEQGINIKQGAIIGWIRGNKRPFLDHLLTPIPESSKELSVEKAYILGVLCGDGYISTGYRIGLAVCDKEFADYFRYCLEQVYSVKPSFTIKQPPSNNFCLTPKPQHNIMLVSKLVATDLVKYHPSYKTFEWTVPEQIIAASKDIQASFIRGFADSEGSVKNRHRNREIILCSGNIQGLDDIRKMLLETFGINSYYNRRKNSVFVIAIGDYRSLDIFRNEIGFIIRSKQEKLEAGLAYYKRKGLRKYSLETKQRALEMLQEGKTYVEIGKLLGTSYANIHDWEKAAKDPEYYRKRYQKWKVQQKT